ncbi:hypothetical protein [Actinoallomurus sp. NPDC052274]|uniref:hypothetical protein n=1 Tax=Actinoallomurus sp. NPDC052274 TaxID=3155420 RepID=UPI00341D8344
MMLEDLPTELVDAIEQRVREQVARDARHVAAELTVPSEVALLRWFATRTEGGST